MAKADLNRKQVIDKAVASMTPGRIRSLVEFSVDIGIAAIVAGCCDNEDIPKFIIEQGRRIKELEDGLRDIAADLLDPLK